MVARLIVTIACFVVNTEETFFTRYFDWTLLRTGYKMNLVLIGELYALFNLDSILFVHWATMAENLGLDLELIAD